MAALIASPSPAQHANATTSQTKDELQFTLRPTAVAVRDTLAFAQNHSPDVKSNNHAPSELHDAPAQSPSSDALALIDPAILASTELVPPEQAEQLALQPEERTDPFNFYAGVDFVSMYISRGMVFSSKASVQPWLELDVPIRSGEAIGPFDSVSWFIGNWNSIQDGDPGLGQNRSGRELVIDNWYETDLYGGLRVTFAEHFGSSLRLNYYTSPSDSFEEIYEIDWRISYNDAHWWTDSEDDAGNFALNPSLRIAKEIDDKGGADGWYFQPALRPSYTFTNLPVDVTVQVPFVFGFGADGQYLEPNGDEIHFGFFQTGIGASIPLDVLPEDAGSLSLSAAVDVIFVTDPDINFRGNETETVAKIGLTYAY